MADVRECRLCGAPLSDFEERASEADPRVPEGQHLCEQHRRQFSACEAIRQKPGRA